MKQFCVFLLLFTVTIFPITAAPKGGAASSMSSPPGRESSFSALEQQQISIETPGLFNKSQSFQIDFTAIPANAYSFPLPVGKLSGSTTSEIELETKKGDAVKAMFDGVVRLSRNVPNYGNVIVIRHDNGLETVYANNAENLVSSGTRVQAGRTIAIVGEKGGKGFLLFAIMVNGNRINPSTILDVRKHTLRHTTLVFTKDGTHVTVRTKRSMELNREEKNRGNVAPVAWKPAKPKAEESAPMDLETNDPFQGKAVFRLNLDKIKQGEWHYPLDDSHVISGFGGKRGHAGVDIKNGPGTNVYAAFDGKVVQSGNFAGYGKCITIRHANGLETRYSHNMKNFVASGDMVKAGQVIGLVGRTGRATTEHLHFETRIAGRAFNPEYVFDHKNHTLQPGTLQFKRGGSVVRLK